MLLIQAYQRVQQQNFPFDSVRSTVNRKMSWFWLDKMDSSKKLTVSYSPLARQTMCWFHWCRAKKSESLANMAVVRDRFRRFSSSKSPTSARFCTFPRKSTDSQSQRSNSVQKTKSSSEEKKDGAIRTLRQHTYGVVFRNFFQVEIFHTELSFLVNLNNGSWHQNVAYGQFEVFGELELCTEFYNKIRNSISQ